MTAETSWGYVSLRCHPGEGRESGGWSAPTRLAGSIGAPFDHFGYSVGISRDTAIIGAYGSDLDTVVGVAYIFGPNDSGWNEQQILAADDGQVGNDFGFSVAITDGTAVIGAPLTDISIGLVPRDRQGAAYVFHRDGPLWKQTDKLIASDGAAGDVLGYSVAVGGLGVIAGAPGDDVAGRSNQGSASIFQQLDSDGDGLPDEWEKKGVTIEGSFIDLPKMGADPLHKDIFIHADWMATGPNGAVLKPGARAIKMVTDAFAASPVTNPDNKKGVRLHVDVGPNSIMNPRTGAKWGTLSRAGQVPFQETLGAFGDAPGFLYNWGDFDEVKEATFDVTVQKPERLLMPTHLDVLDPPPDAKTHEVADFHCYQVKVQKKRADGTPLAPFPKGVQLDAGDRFQSRRYELRKLTRLCYPVAESGAPAVLKTGVPISFTPAALRHETVHLACYQAKPAKKRIAQDGCAPLDPKDKGTKIVPAPPKHQKQVGLEIRSQLGAGVLDTAKELEFCIPSTVTPR